ncbi:slr0971 [Synechocystis sp. PCC 6803]|uniref:Slr0971 protein n=1 Tax=Synechocystis sp. (strain ATCC 27184 / PCC 6803 / Kazusa) TaxID=1111708 RepID=P72863_SYNY3|nr:MULTISPECIES: DUF4335 domain-containing protein [unclassified Synechocystis]BAM50590.1 hypothetical protein BEST7613_1659 [Synechocystis sp. PCC 6803] [Bacillus subtilis BEST7613]AGF50568.1 hypothetical protein MYO_13060 [Synechocystis sp. PCC 6803]ALJ66645.1 hypothetical protein AOY38_01560 [Synechocystis sp. PCC 6803]AVP88488.1 DUF4335 domain-containing protein [Synechocystis sp. IPPAS B-1465]MBD2617167.1 DUF4335 domain-containing protein [Synechocystis sp. FACHB-898]
MKLVKDVQLRRYTPPTCTLELWQTRRVWQRPPQTLPADYRFALHFDDPRLPEVEQLTLSGTPEELEALALAVETYLQQRLNPCASLEPSTYPEPVFNADGEPSFCLRPQGLWSHELLGMGAPITLNTSQLYDLMLALEGFRLQDLEPSRMSVLMAREQSPKALVLAGMVAAGSVAAIAIAALWMRQPQPEVAVQNNFQLPMPNQFQFEEVSSMVPPPPRGDTPSPQLAPILALRDPLPSPSAVLAAAPPPRNPNIPLVVPPERVRPPDLQAPGAPGETYIAIPDPTNLQPLTPPPEPSYPGALAILPRPDGQPLPYGGEILSTTPDLPPLPPASNPVSFRPPRPRAVPPRSTNLLDTIPQVAEVRKFYQEQWQPPEDQTQTLEYRLQIDPSGTVKRTMPLGRAASIYMARLPQPAPGEPLVSPLADDRMETIRLVLTPLGDVKAFLEDQPQ